MRRDPVEIVHSIADTLRKAPSGEILRVNDVAKGADVQWATAARYVALIHFVQASLPIVELEEKAGTKFVRIIRNQWLDSLSGVERLVSTLFEAEALSSKRPVEIPASLKGALQGASDEGLVKSVGEGNAFLTIHGIEKAMALISPTTRSFDRALSDSVVGAFDSEGRGQAIREYLGASLFEQTCRKLQAVTKQWESVLNTVQQEAEIDQAGKAKVVIQARALIATPAEPHRVLVKTNPSSAA